LKEATTIKLFLVHGSPKGLRTAELSNWSGKAIAAPRIEIKEFLKRVELDSPGVYLLTGVDPVSGDNAIYIGEAENVSVRLKGHANKDFWNSVTVFVSKDENLTKSHIRYLEGKLIELALEVGSLYVINSVGSGAKLPEPDAAEMDVFLQKILQLLPVLGISHFHKLSEEKKSEEDLLYCKIKGLTATGKRTANGFVVFSGSQAVLKDRESANNLKMKREDFLSKGFLIEKEDHLFFTKDIEFGSPSTAGGIIRGGSTNGLTSWKNSNGIELKEIERIKNAN